MTIKPMKNLFLQSMRRKKKEMKIVFVTLFVLIISFVLFEGTKNTVTLTLNGKSKEVTTHAQTVADLLQEQNITTNKYDEVSPSLKTELVYGMTVNWEQARKVTISVNGNQKTVWTTEKLVKNILREANIAVSGHDELSLDLDAEVGAENKIDIQKAFQLTLVDGQSGRQVWSTSTTVANFLKQQNIQLNEFDRVEHEMEDTVKPNSKITIVRIEKVTDVVEESLDFETETKKDSSLLVGQKKVVTKGVPGEVERTYEIIKKNGKIVQKTVQNEKVIKKPTTKVLAVGTKQRVATVVPGSGEEPVASGQEFYVEASAYTPYCKGCSGKTATGIDLRSNPNLKLVAVDPSIIPLGSKVWIEGYGHAIAADTGGSIQGRKVDLLMPSKQAAYKWGRKTVRIKVLN